ncbi:MAG: hypothetical protein JWO30_2652 [Fibrobacteres bacterium]|nr:hypothetical protein [Fibrobacterota bacterium]
MVSARLADGEVFDSAKLKNTVRFLIENDMRNVVIDLGNLEYLYSDTINAFIASNRHMLEVSGRIAILTEHPKVQDILKRAGLDNIMRIYRSEAEMIADSKEILRQTSSYRIEELQKISTQPPEAPPIPKTEFDEFKAEMGQRLGSKLDNNELPQYQLGVPAPAAPTFNPAPNPRDPETAYPSFNPPGFGSQQVPEAPAQGFPQPQPAPAYNFNNQAFGGMANTTPTFPGQNPQNFNQAPPNFDFPTVQLPVGQFGNLSQPQAPVAPQGGDRNGTPSQDAMDADNLADPRQRKPSQERMRSPNARKQQGRRVGGREFPGQDEESSQQERPIYSEERMPEPPSRDNDKYAAYGNLPPANPNSLAEEARTPAKLFILVFLIGLGVAAYYFLSKKSAEKPVLDNPTTQEQPVVPAPETPSTPPAAQAPVAPTTPQATPAAPAAPAAPEAVPAKPPVAEVPKPPAPTPKPAPEPKPKLGAHKVPKKERIEKPAPAPAPSEEPTATQAKSGLHITSNPPGADVLINFSKKGTTPIDVNLANNSNKIIVRLQGYKRFETTLPKNHPDHELEVNLEKEDGSEPAKPVAAKPAPEPERVQPKPEARPAPDEDPEDLPMKAQAPVRARDPEPEVAAPKPRASEAPAPGDGPIGIIFLSSSPARADIIIDGKNTGKKTPAKLELPSGQHRIEMSKSGQKSTVDQLVNEGKNKALHLTLQ